MSGAEATAGDERQDLLVRDRPDDSDPAAAPTDQRAPRVLTLGDLPHLTPHALLS